MGFEYIYAYLENIKGVAAFGTVLLSTGLIGLIIARIVNGIDKDDWVYLMVPATALFFLSLTIVCAPGKQHIKDVKLEMDELYKSEQVKEEVKVLTRGLSCPPVPAVPPAILDTGLTGIGGFRYGGKFNSINPP